MDGEDDLTHCLSQSVSFSVPRELPLPSVRQSKALVIC